MHSGEQLTLAFDYHAPEAMESLALIGTVVPLQGSGMTLNFDRAAGGGPGQARQGLQVVTTLVVQDQVQALGFLVAINTQAHESTDNFQQNEGDDGGIYQGRDHTDRLHAKLAPDAGNTIRKPVAAEYAQLGGTENTRQQRAQDTPHPVDRETRPGCHRHAVCFSGSRWRSSIRHLR